MAGEFHPNRPAALRYQNGGVKRSLAVAVICAALLAGYGAWVAGGQSNPQPVGDAIVVHAGGRGERLDHALDLMRAGSAPTLVIMRGSAPTWPQANELCGRREPFEVLCPPPDPDTTIGEALALRDLVNARNWTSVVAVTSDYHLRRVMYLDAKCTRATVAGSAAPSELAPPVYAARVAKEMVAMLQAVIVSC